MTKITVAHYIKPTCLNYLLDIYCINLVFFSTRLYWSSKSMYAIQLSVHVYVYTEMPNSTIIIIPVIV